MYRTTWQGVQHVNQNKQRHALSFRHCNLVNAVNNLHNLLGWAKEEFFKMYQDFILFDAREQRLHNIIDQEKSNQYGIQAIIFL